MVWDGLPFFGFDDTKLARLNKNGHYEFTDKCTSFKWMAFTLGSFSIAIAIIASQVKNIGTIKSQEIQLMSNAGYSFNISE